MLIVSLCINGSATNKPRGFFKQYIYLTSFVATSHHLAVVHLQLPVNAQSLSASLLYGTFIRLVLRLKRGYSPLTSIMIFSL